MGDRSSVQTCTETWGRMVPVPVSGAPVDSVPERVRRPGSAARSTAYRWPRSPVFTGSYDQGRSSTSAGATC